jgi:hypothetical protein
VARIAEKPLNWDAVDAANDDFYAAHPEFIVDGCRIPLDPCDPAQADLRDEWMDLYEEAGGAVYYGKFTPPCDDPVAPCPGEAFLMVQVVIEDGTPIEGALVELVAGTAMEKTSAEGWVDLGSVPAPLAHTVRVSAPGYATEWGSDQVAQNETAVIVVVLEKDPDPPPPPPPRSAARATRARLASPRGRQIQT